jgi:hypothetical protein
MRVPRFLFYGALLSLVAVGARGQDKTVPEQETEFCVTAENSNSAYGALARDRAEAEKRQNGIRVQQIEQQMTALYHQRNDDIFRLMKRKNFLVEDWVATVVKISSPIENCHTNMPSCIHVDVQPACSSIVVIHATMASTPTQIQFLAAKQQGDRLVMSGVLVAQWGGKASAAAPVMPTSSEEFEGSFRESGSMTKPEYSAHVTQLR